MKGRINRPRNKDLTFNFNIDALRYNFSLSPRFRQRLQHERSFASVCISQGEVMEVKS